MTRKVKCRLYGEELEGLPRPPFPGASGMDIFENVSAKAWQAWLKLQTMLINEKRLDARDPDAKKYLAEQRKKFFAGEETDTPAGFRPPE